MSHEIPKPFCWNESFKVFYELLDEEHKGLFKGIFDLDANKSCGKALAHLLDVVEKHFHDEEGMMEKAHYAEIAPHKQMHHDFVAKLKGLKAPVDDATIHFAMDWLVNHIKNTDFKYKGKL
uniref:Hemerythrin n=1 Tax=Capilloventer sp. Capillo2 TaxID=2032690 RepID=A0A286RT27_9ANNE|nr:hemerythrin [Capilloventer sp. Capillo2]